MTPGRALDRRAALRTLGALGALAAGDVRQALAADAPLNVTRVGADEGRRLTRGEVVSIGLPDGSDRDIAVGLAMFVRAPLARVAEYLASGEVVTGDPTLIAWGLVQPGADASAFSKFRYTTGESDEAQDLLEVSPGSKFNLSAAEIEAFRKLQPAASSKDRSAVVDAVSAQYRQVLYARWLAYEQRGLAGIERYARRSGASDPATDLRGAHGDLALAGPGGARAQDLLAREPASPETRAVSRYYWLKRKIRGRPTVILLHAVVETRPESALHVERHFFVANSYDSGQVAIGAVPYQDGVVAFALSRVATDQVAGFGTDMKRAMGRQQMRGEIQKRLERLLALVPRPAATESP